MTITDVVEEFDISLFKITKMRERGSNDVVIAEHLKGASYRKCDECETFNKVEVNGTYVCLECHPEYQELFTYRGIK